MPFQDDLVGTVTLTSGSTAFTWAGAALNLAQVQGGDTIYLPGKGLTFVIGSVSSATAGVLTNNCPAAGAGAAQVARIRFQSDLARVQAKTWQAIELLGNGLVSAIAGIDATGGSKLIELTGPGAASPLTMAAAMKAALAGQQATVVTDLNTLVAPGPYGISNAAAGGGPAGMTGPALVLHLPRAIGGGITTRAVQLLWENGAGTGDLYFRTMNNSATWQPWVGIVGGPASATADNVALFNGTTGKLLKNGFPVSTFAKTVLDDADGGAMLATIQSRYDLGSVADDTAVSIVMPTWMPNNRNGVEIIANNPTTRGAGKFICNTGGQPGIVPVSQVGSIINIVAGGGSLGGTTGPDGNLNIRTNGGGLFYLENRTGGSAFYSIALTG